MSEKAGFLGRFQPLHLGHQKVIEKRRKEFKEFEIIIGSPEKSRTEENPLTFEERKSLVKACFPKISIEKLEDTEKTPSGNKKWAENLEEMNIDVIISGNDLVEEIVSNHTELKHIRPDMFKKNIYSGSEIRRRINSDEEWRYLTPKCSHDVLDSLLEKVKMSGTQYEFEPGWKKDNAYHGTAEK